MKEKEIKVVEKKQATPKEKKTSVKNIPVTKLPKIFKKKYSKSGYIRKISKHIYIPKDKVFVDSFFKPLDESNEKSKVAIPSDLLLSKQDLAHFKVLAKDIKKQKSRIKWLPLIACFSVVFIIFATVIIFKDKLIKNGIESIMEKIFEAKCDIEYLHLGLLDASFNIKQMEVANKNNTMTNLFEIGEIKLDFDLANLLRKRFVAQELLLTGIQIGTEREEDGALPQIKKEKSEFEKKLINFATEKKQVVENSITEIFQQYNPETLLENFYSNLKSPILVEEAEETLSQIIPSWKNVPSEIEETIESTISQGQAALDFNWGGAKKDVAKLTEGINLVTKALEEVDTTKKDLENTINKLKKDTDTVSSLMNNVTTSISSDYEMLQNQINQITSFSIKEDGMNIITDAFKTIVADLLGNYYPMFEQVISYIDKLNIEKKASETKKEESTNQRKKGRFIEYSNNKPSFLIEKAHGSGVSENFALDIVVTDISNDMDKWGKSASIKGTAVHGKMTDTISGSLDLRENRNTSMLQILYNGAGYSVSLALPEEERVTGVPSVSGIGSFSGNLSVDSIDDFDISLDVFLNQTEFTVEPFEPEFGYDLYMRALDKFSSVRGKVGIAYNPDTFLDIDVSTDIGERFVQILSELINEELDIIKEKSRVRVKEILDNASANFNAKFNEFNDIKDRIEQERKKLDEFENKLEKAKQDAENKIKEATAQATEKATEAVKTKIDSAVEDAKKTTTDAIKGLFGR